MRSGVEHAVAIDTPARALWYSGRERPAWRMYQTGVRGTGWRRQARTSRESAVKDVTPRIVSQAPGGMPGMAMRRVFRQKAA
jgi:hypothetical protein